MEHEEILTDLVNEVFIITNPRLPDKPIIYVDEHFAQFIGYKVEEMLGHNSRQLLQKDLVSEKSKIIFKEVLSKNEERTFEMLNFKKDGTPFVNRFRMTPYTDGDGQIVFLVAKHVSVHSLYLSAIRYVPKRRFVQLFDDLKICDDRNCVDSLQQTNYYESQTLVDDEKYNYIYGKTTQSKMLSHTPT